MKFTIPNKSLKEALDRLGNIPGAKGSIPHTQAVRFSADMSGLKLTRFTNEAKIVVMVDDAEIEDDQGEFTVDHAAISNRVARTNGKVLSLETDAKSVHLKSGKSAGKVNLFVDEMEMDAPEFDANGGVNLPIEHLLALMAAVTPAMHTDDSEPTFKSVNFRMMGERMALVATDKRRCHIALYDIQIAQGGIMASEGAQAVLRAFAGQEGACTLTISETQIGISTSSIEIVTSLVNEQYPDIPKFLSQFESSKVFKLKVSRDEFSRALRSCMDLGEDSSKLVALSVGREMLRVSASDKQGVSEQSDEVDCESDGEFVIGVPSMQLVDAMEIMDVDGDGRIEICLANGGRGILISQPDRVATIALKKL